MSDQAAGGAPESRPRPTVQPGALWANLSALVPSALLASYTVWQALGNLLGLAGYARSLGVTIVWWGWLVLVGAVLTPVVALAIAARATWRAPIGVKWASYLTTLAVLSSLYLSTIALFNDTNLFVLPNRG